MYGPLMQVSGTEINFVLSIWVTNLVDRRDANAG